MHSEITIPNKSLFKLDEVCSLISVKPYVLRFWESEFEQIAPILSSSGQKLFEHKDIEAAIIVKELLFEKKMTIENAKFELDKIYNEAASLENNDTEVIEVISEELVAKDHESAISLEISNVEIAKLNQAKGLLASLVSRTEAIQRTQNWC